MYYCIYMIVLTHCVVLKIQTVHEHVSLLRVSSGASCRATVRRLNAQDLGRVGRREGTAQSQQH